jgi:cbb3-type cytochrome oxidase maturation protein
MSVLFLVVPLALLVVGGAVWAFVWAAGRGQFDDLDTPAVRMLRDDGDVRPPTAARERLSTASPPADTAAPVRTTPH